jgi:Protein of unknown function (DUF3617)
MSIAPPAAASDAMLPGVYDVVTETGMPHLEENLRYATTRTKRCLGPQDLATVFPILTDPSMQGCKLVQNSRDVQAVSYVLSCEDKNATTGAAQWHLGASQISGTLNVKLAGKNMTFYQRITAQRVGKCVSEGK